MFSHVRQRRWFRHRAIAAKMDAKTAARLSDEAIGRMTAAELRLTIASGGLAHRDCPTREALRARAREARDAARVSTPRDSSVTGGGAPSAAASTEEKNEPRPLMPPVSQGSRLQLQLPGSTWSAPVLIEAAGTHGLLEIEAANHFGVAPSWPPTPGGQPAGPSRAECPGNYQLGLSINSCPGVFGRSKMLTVSPRVLLCNQLPRHAIAYKQHGSSSVGEVLFPGDDAPFHWRHPLGARLLSVSLLRATVDRADDTTEELSRCDWSCAFPISDVGDFTVVIKPPDAETRRQKLFLNVDVQVSGAESKIIFSLQDASLAPYRIDNLTNHQMLISQSPCQELEHPRVVEEVPPNGSMAFAWEQVADKPTLDLHVANVRVPVCLDDLQLEGQLLLPPSDDPERLKFRTAADGPIKVLQVLPDERFGGRDKLEGRFLPSKLTTHAGDGRVRTQFTVSFAQIGLSLIDSTPRELLFLSVKTLSLGVTSSRAHSSVSLTVRSMQIDNQLPNAVFPVLLQPHWTAEELVAGGGRAPPAIELRLQCNLTNPGLSFYETISLRVQTLQLMVDTLLARTLVIYFLDLHSDLMQILTRLLNALLPALGLSGDDARATYSKIYVHWLNIQPLRVLVSCRSVAGGIKAETLTHGAPDAAISLLNSVGALLLNFDRVPIKLKALVLESAFAPTNVLLMSVGSSYQEQVLSQMYKMLLSFEVLGNPRGLFKKAATGVQDFFYEPIAALNKGPEEFKAAVHRGGQSFHENVMLSVADSAHRMTGALAKGLAELTGDKDYLEERATTKSAAQSRNRAAQHRTVGEGLLAGADTVGSGITRGLTGLFSEPVKGAQKEGPEGFVKGLGKGLLGAIVKPAVGVVDAVNDGLTKTAAEMNAGQGVFAQRARLPRALGASGQVLSFSRADAEAQQQLAVLIQSGGKRLKSIAEGRFIAARPCGGPRQFGMKRLVVTTTHAISLHLGGGGHGGGGSSSGSPHGPTSPRHGEQPVLEWFERLSSIATLEESATEIVLHLRDGGMRFVPCHAGRQERKELYEIVEQGMRSLQAAE